MRHSICTKRQREEKLNDKPSLMPVWDCKAFENPRATNKTSARISIRIVRVNGEGMSHIRRPTRTLMLWR